MLCSYCCYLALDKENNICRNCKSTIIKKSYTEWKESYDYRTNNLRSFKNRLKPRISFKDKKELNKQKLFIFLKDAFSEIIYILNKRTF